MDTQGGGREGEKINEMKGRGSNLYVEGGGVGPVGLK